MIQKIKDNYILVAFLLGLVAFITIFCPIVLFDYGGVIAVGITGSQASFGLKLMEEEIFEFSFFNFITYFLTLAAVICIYMHELKKDSRLLVGAIVCFCAATLLFFLSVEFLQYANSEIKKEIKTYVSLGAGAVIGGISCLIAALCTYLGWKENSVKNIESVDQ